MEINMRKIMIAFFCSFLLFSTAFAVEFKSIREFSYKGISFSSSIDDLKTKGFSCQDKNCIIGDSFFTYEESGLFSIEQNARNGKTVTFHEDHPLKIVIDQLYPDTGEPCSVIIDDIKNRFNSKYNADIEFKIYPSRYGGYTDRNTIAGSVKLGEDILRVGFSCSKVKKPNSNESLTFVHALFHYENLASRLLIDDI